jgi:uncharacterized protein (DUF608 family)
MRAYSPFIPLDENNSGLPATVFNITVKNKSNLPVKIMISGWLENKTAMYTAMPGSQQRENIKYKTENATGVYSTVINLAYPHKKIEDNFDYGTLCLTALDSNAIAGSHITDISGDHVFEINKDETTRKSAQQKLIGNVTTSTTIAPTQTSVFDYIICWHTPNLVIGDGKTVPDKGKVLRQSI